ncbi:MAG: LysR family transcriptional regulator [Myxococcota bacterium]
MAITEAKDVRSDLHLFVRVVEAGSLRAVAQELNVQPSAVSRRLAQFETRLGVKLLDRGRSRSTPTDAGQRYYDEVRPLLEQLDIVEGRVRGLADAPAGTLRVAAPVDFGARFVAPILAALSRRHHALDIELVLRSRFSDLIAERIDVAVRVGSLRDSALVATKLGEVPRVLVASRAYCEARGRPETVEDLRDHEFVFYGSVQRRARLTFADGTSVEMRGRFAVNSVRALVALVENGHGLHLGPRWAFEEGLASGDIVPLMPDRPLASFPLYALRPESRFVPAKTRAFVSALREVTRESPCLRGMYEAILA